MRAVPHLGFVALLAGAAAPAPASTPRPPSAAEAMAALCGLAVADDESGCMVEGQHISAWRNVQFEIDGAPGFALLATVTEEADSDEPGFHAPDERLSLAQISYRYADGRWHQASRQIHFGSIAVSGAAGNPPIVGNGAPYTLDTPTGGSLIGLPITRLVPGGISITGYSMFRVAPEDGGGWAYAGDIDTGIENGADCDGDDTRRRCYASTGTIRPLPVRTAGVSAWPDFEVAVKGTVVGRGGKIRTATADDNVIWRFSDRERTYVPVVPVAPR